MEWTLATIVRSVRPLRIRQSFLDVFDVIGTRCPRA